MMHSRRAVPAGGISRQQLLTCDKNEKQLKKDNQKSRKDGKSEGVEEKGKDGKERKRERERDEFEIAVAVVEPKRREHANRSSSVKFSAKQR